MIRINLSAWSEQVHGLRHIIRVPVRSELSPPTAALQSRWRVIAVAGGVELG